MWTLTEFQIPENLMMAPWLILYTLIDEKIFIDLQRWNETGVKVPREGFA